MRQTSIHRWDVLTLDNGTLEVAVLPAKGGDIWQLRHLPSQSQVLWESPLGLPQGPRVSSDAQFETSCEGGWQDLLPNGGAACEVDRTTHQFHGESWRLPWSWRLVGETLRLSVLLETVPLRVVRSMQVRNSTLRIEEQVENVGPRTVPFMWGHHVALGGDLLTGGCEIDLAGARVEGFGELVDPTSRLGPVFQTRWPFATGRDGNPVDLHHVPGPELKAHDVALLTDLRADWYAVRNPYRRVGFALRFSSDVFRWLWMWQAYGGANTAAFNGRAYTLALEPWTSPPSLARALARGQARSLSPNESVEATLEATIFEASRPVRGVESGGRIIEGGD